VRCRRWRAAAARVLLLAVSLDRRTGAPTSPILGGAPSPTQHEVLQNFFKSLLNPKDRAASPGTSAVSPGAAPGKPRAVVLVLVVRVRVGIRRRILMQAAGRRIMRSSGKHV